MNQSIKTETFAQKVVKDALDTLYKELLYMREKQEQKAFGALTAAAVKRAKVAVIMSYLDKCELDLTIASANKIFKAILKRGVDQKFWLRYGTTGRTAANKTQVLASDMRELIKLIEPQLQDLQDNIPAITYQAFKESTKFARYGGTTVNQY